MPAVARTLASLRIGGDKLDPDEISALLGARPTRAVRKGDRRTGSSGCETLARTGIWSLKAAERQPGDLDAQIHEILGQVSGDLGVWGDLARRYRCDIFCGLFIDEGNAGLDLERQTLGLLAARRLSLGFDIYGPLS